MTPFQVFVIQPYRRKYSDLLYSLIKEVCAAEPELFHCFRADEPGNKASKPRLQDRIDDFIKSADICISDLSSEGGKDSPRNDNVLLETGAAYALQKPVIPLTGKGDPLPSDITGNFYHEIDGENLSMQREDFKINLRERLAEAVGLIRQHEASQFMVYGYEDRNHIDFYHLICRSKKRISFITTNLDFFVNQELETKTGSPQMTLLQMIASEMGQKPETYEVKVLTLDPDSNYANERADALDIDRRTFRENLRENLTKVEEFIKSNDCTRACQLRTYQAFPLQMTCFFDDLVTSSVVADGRSSRYCIAYSHSLEVRGARETYERHFDKVWVSGRPVATSNFKKTASKTWHGSNR